MITTTTTYSALSIILSIAVILSGAHIKDIATLAMQPSADVRSHDSDASHTKVGVELHSHTDKVNLKSLLAHSTIHIDSRSLKLRHQQHKHVFKALLHNWLR